MHDAAPRERNTAFEPCQHPRIICLTKQPLPAGTVTFLLTDIEGSTIRWEADPSGMRAAMARHDSIIDEQLEVHRGIQVEAGREGDSILAAFGRAADAASAAIAIQSAFAAGPWPAGMGLGLRIALHTGEVELRGGHYFGPTIYRCARLLAAGNGGQILVTQATQQLLADEPPVGSLLADRGEHRLKDLRRPERIFQLTAPGVRADTRPLRTLDSRLTNLPFAVSSFVGREDQLSELARLLRATRLLTLTGAGGSGKTSLAYHLAAEVLEGHPDGVWVVELGTVADPAQVLGAVASGLQVLELPRRTLSESIVEGLKARKVLILLDNCEHLLDATAELVSAILAACPGAKVLATSREPLGLAGEVTWRVPSLPAPDAEQLFRERALGHRPDLQLPADDPAVAEICRRLDGIPLAIELAAAHVSAFTVEQIQSHLGDRFRLLSGGTRTAPARQRTLEATVEWSYDLLNPDQKALLRRLSVFAGGFDLGGAAMVAGKDVVRDLFELVRKSLVSADEGRYGFLETIREFAGRRLAESGDEADVRARFGSYMLDLAKGRQPGKTAEWLDRLELEHDNLRIALDYADRESGLQLSDAAFEFWYMRGHLSEGRAAVEGALALASEDAPQRATCMVHAGACRYDQGDNAGALEVLGEALELARAKDDSPAVGYGLHILGLVDMAAGNPVAAEACFEEGLGVWQELHDPSNEAEMLYNLGLLAGSRGDVAGARDLLARSIQIRRRAGREDETHIALTFTAAVAVMASELEPARTAMRESLLIGRRLGDRRLAWSLDVCACLAIASGEAEQGLRLAGAGHAMHEGSGVSPSEVWRSVVEAYLAPAREKVGEGAAEAADATGRKLGYDDAIDFALDSLATKQLS
ncbi:MAG TPA: tetratricopeptide repeat protein [Candidatus Dormibacteraeota bacterium]